MALVWATYVLVLVVTVPVQASLAYWVFAHHDDVRGSRWFAFSLFLGFVWAIFQFVMFVVADPEIQWIVRTFAEKTAMGSFMAWIVFASLYSGSDFHRHWLARAGLGYLIINALTPSFVSPFSELFYEQRVVIAEPFQYVTVEPGLVYLSALLVIVVLAGAAMTALVRYLLSTPRDSGYPLVLLVLGALSIPLFTISGKLGLFPATQLNHSTYGLLPFSLFMTFALFRFRLFDIQPVARNAVVEELQDPVFVLEADRCLVDYNQAAKRLVPAVESGVGQPFDAVFPALGESLVFPEDEAETTTEISMTTNDRTRHYSVNVSQVGGQSQAHANWYSVVLRDVTELERSRNQLQAQNERLDQVASTISHDLRNPIQVALGNTERIRTCLGPSEIESEDRHTVLDAVDTTQASLERMEDILSDLLTIAREGKTIEDAESLSLAAVASDAWQTVDTRSASLTVAEDTTVQADRSKLRSILENLFRNSVEHGPDDVTVTIGSIDDGFFVADDGPGIDQSATDKIFEYGYTTSDEGTGLGLSIVRTMAESHGWSVHAEPGDTGGVRFVFASVSSARADRIGSEPHSQ